MDHMTWLLFYINFKNELSRSLLIKILIQMSRDANVKMSKIHLNINWILLRTDPRSRTSTWGEPLGWYLGFTRFLRVAGFFFAWFRAFWASMAGGIDWVHTMYAKELTHIVRVFVSLKFWAFFSPRAQGAAYHAGNPTWITFRFLDWIRKFRIFMIP